MKNLNVVKRGRPSKVAEVKSFDPSSVKLLRGSELKFNDSLFKPMSRGPRQTQRPS